MNTQAQADRLVTDLKRTVQDSEALLLATKDAVGEQARAVRNRLTEALHTAKTTCARWEDRAVQSARQADKAVHAHPYRTAGAAFGIGLVLGVLATRK